MTVETLDERLVRKKPRCYFCNREVSEEDYCYGCREYICDDCDEMIPVGRHKVEDHKGNKDG